MIPDFKSLARETLERRARQIDHEILMYLLKGYGLEQITVRRWPDKEENGRITLRSDVYVCGEPRIAALVKLLGATK